MSNFVTQTLAAELTLLVGKLQGEGHPSVARVLPFWKPEYLEDVTGCWQRMDQFRQELARLQATLSYLVLLVSQLQQQQQQGVPPPPLPLSFAGLQPLPPESLAGQARPLAKRHRKPAAPRKKQKRDYPSPGSSGSTASGEAEGGAVAAADVAAVPAQPDWARYFDETDAEICAAAAAAVAADLDAASASADPA